MPTLKRNDSRFLIWLLITIFYCYQYILRLIPNIISYDIMLNFNILASKLGFFSSTYYIGYVLFHIPIALAITRIGLKMILSVSIALTAIGLWPLIYPVSWKLAVIARLLSGIGSSAAAIGAIQIFRIIYPLGFTRMLGLMVSVGLIVAGYLGKVITLGINALGIKIILNILLYFGFLIAVLTYNIIPNLIREKESKSFLLIEAKSVFGNYKLLFTSFFSGLMIGPIEGFADTWGSIFLVNVYGLNKIDADSLSLLILIGMSIGCILLPYIADKTNWHFFITIISGIVLFFCFYYILSDASIASLNYICITIGIFSSYQVVILAKITTFVSKKLAPLAGAISNMIIMSCGCFFQNSIGFLLDLFSANEFIKTPTQYSKDAFIKSILIIPSAIIVAIVGLTLVAVISKKKSSP